MRRKSQRLPNARLYFITLTEYPDFFGTFDEESFVARSLTSEQALDMLVLPQVKSLLSDRNREQWRFPPESIALIEQLIRDLESGTFTA